eukprot:Mrub_03354.p1 GENE.Mrub_03354~~Mrub_03354.p1  ORF type:complete len:470 (-),score=37.79 Mrub_03354:62-1372(-)
MIIGDLKSIGFVSGIKGVGQLLGSVCLMPLIDKVSIPVFVRISTLVFTCSIMFTIYSWYTEYIYFIYSSQFIAGFSSAGFFPVVNTIIAKSSNAENRTTIYLNFTSLSMLAYSFGPLFVAFVFKAIKDEWDLGLCKIVVFSGYLCMNASILILLLIDDKIFEKEEKKEDKKIKEEVGDGWLNPILNGILAHKIIGVFACIGMRYYAVFWKDNVGLSPFWSQIVSFVKTILGAVLSSLVAPILCHQWGESATVGIIDTFHVAFYYMFLVLYSLSEISGGLTMGAILVITLAHTIGTALGICDMGIYKTIKMDYTPSIHRGKWNMVDSIVSGSANFLVMLGGILCEYTGIIGLFYIVAFIKLINLSTNFYIYMLTKDKYNEKVRNYKQKCIDEADQKLLNKNNQAEVTTSQGSKLKESDQVIIKNETYLPGTKIDKNK